MNISLAQDKELSELMRKSQGGDKSAYRDLLLKLVPVVSRLVSREARGMESELREEIVQEVLVAIHNKRHTYEPTRPFVPWVMAIARFKTIDVFRHRPKDEVAIPPEEFERLEESGASTQVEMEGLSSLDLDALLSQLPEKQVLVLRHTKIEGLSVAETARKLGLSESDVKVSVHRAIQTLKKLNEERS